MERKKILIIDQESASREKLVEAFSDKYTVLHADSGSEAVMLARNEDPDMVILDHNLQNAKQVNLCNELKDAGNLRYVPIIILSDNKQINSIIAGQYAGADDYMTKPVNINELITRVDTHLRTREYYSDLDKKDLLTLLELTEVVSVVRNPKRILKLIVEKMVQSLDISRCSIISLTDCGDLTVLASSDLPDGQEVKLELRNYPEIEKALSTQRPVVLQNIASSAIMDPVRDKVKRLSDKAILVVPIIKKQNVIGTFFLRTASPLRDGITDRVFKMCLVVANTVGNALENAVFFESMQNTKNIFEDMAVRDSLTKLYNHQYYHTRSEEEFSRAQRYRQPMSCVFVDIDDFKSINDRYGHITGDIVLKQIGRLIKNMLRKSDVAARYGGEEFALLLPNTAYEGANEFSSRVLTQIRELSMPRLHGVQVTVSIGIATFENDNVTSYEELLQLADQAMYKAKQLGKNRICQAVIAA